MTVEITNVLSESDLQERYDDVCKDNWLIPKMAAGVKGATIKEIIDNWPTPTRKQLLDKMNIKEHETYKQVYQDKPPK
jgi:hypothetical protein